MGSAGERPVSNMATPILITRTVRESSWWRLILCFQAGLSAKKPILLVRKQSLVAGYVGQQPVKGLVFHGHTTHERQYRFFGRHGCTHSCHSPEVPIQTLDPVGGVCHGLNFRRAVSLAEDIAYLLLSKTFGIQRPGKTVAFLFPIAEDGQYLRMEVAVPVTGNAEFQFPALTIGMARTIAITLV